MFISIALATYQGAGYIQHQLDSFLNQSRPPDQLVVSDDASSDRTLSIIKSFARNAPFPTIVHRNSAPLGCARNFSNALSLCTGDLVFLSDQDDVWFSDKIGQVEQAVLQRPALQLLVNDADLTDEYLVPANLTRLQQTASGGYDHTRFVQGACTAVRRDLLQLALPIPAEAFTHDHWLHSVADTLQVRFVYPTPLQYFRRHASNASHSPTSELQKATRAQALLGGFLRQIRTTEPRSVRLSIQCHQLQILLSWLEDHQTVAQRICPGGKAAIDAQLRLLHEALHTMTIRQRTATTTRPRRIIPTLRLYKSVGQAPHGGPRELAKDILCS